MSISNISNLYQKIGKGAEGGHEFARLLNQLMIAEANERGYEAIISSDSSGDYKGVDCILKQRWRQSERFIYTGVQYKFYPSSLSPQYKSDIRNSLKNAIEKFPEMTSWILITPEDFSKRDMEWLDTLKEEFEYIMTMEEAAERFMDKSNKKWRNELSISQQGATYISSMMLRNPEIGRHYYAQEFFSHEIGKLVLSKISVDTTNTFWRKSGNKQNYFVQDTVFETSEKSSELVFDFQFINNTNLVYHLDQINLLTVEVWTEIKGIPSSEILKSIGTIEFEPDLNKKINHIIFEEILGGPIIFKEKESKRFKLQLNKFAKKCPGNMAKIKFDFVFDNFVINSDIITLSF